MSELSSGEDQPGFMSSRATVTAMPTYLPVMSALSRRLKPLGIIACRNCHRTIYKTCRTSGRCPWANRSHLGFPNGLQL